MKTRNEIIFKGDRIENSLIDTTPADETNLKAAAAAAITDLQTIQSSALTAEASQIAAIKRNAEILEAIIRFVERRIK